MILQVLADVRLIQQAGNAVGFQFAPRPDARQHQQMRRTDRACAQDHFLIGDRGFQSRPLARYSTPLALILPASPPNITRVACAPVMIVRFGRRSASPSRKA